MLDSPLDKGIKSLEYGNRIFREMFNRAYIFLKKVENNILGKDYAADVKEIL